MRRCVISGRVTKVVKGKFKECFEYLRPPKPRGEIRCMMFMTNSKTHERMLEEVKAGKHQSERGVIARALEKYFGLEFGEADPAPPPAPKEPLPPPDRI